MGSKPDTVQAPKMNLKKDIKEYVKGVSAALPKILNMEGQYRPQFQELNLGDINSFLFGAQGKPGLLALGGQATQATGQQLADARSAEIGQMQGQVGSVRNLIGSMSPEAAAQVQRASQEAQRAYTSAQGLTPQEQRMATQQARESFGARGMLDSNASVVGEYMGRDQFLAQKRQEAAQRGAEAFGYANEFYQRPGLQALSASPLSYSAGQQQVQFGLGSIGAGVPQLYDIGAALNIGAAQRQNIVAAQSANAQAQASYSAGLFGAIGNVAGAAGQAAMSFSDRRLKTDIELIGKTEGGFNKYSYRYKHDPSQRFIGVMADEVEKVMPEAVITTDSGYKAVNYSLIH